jgi:hypothetical protein
VEGHDAPAAGTDFLLFGGAPEGGAGPDAPEVIGAAFAGSAVDELDTEDGFAALGKNAGDRNDAAFGRDDGVADLKLADGSEAGRSEHASVERLRFARARSAGEDGELGSEGVGDRGALKGREGEAGFFFGPIDGGLGFDRRQAAGNAGEAVDDVGDLAFEAVVVGKLHERGALVRLRVER